MLGRSVRWRVAVVLRWPRGGLGGRDAGIRRRRWGGEKSVMAVGMAASSPLCRFVEEKYVVERRRVVGNAVLD